MKDAGGGHGRKHTHRQTAERFEPVAQIHRLHWTKRLFAKSLTQQAATSAPKVDPLTVNRKRWQDYRRTKVFSTR